MSEICIVIPVFNAEKTLSKCLDSIFNQTFKNYTIIAVNDGSTDSSEKILLNYKDKITVIKQQNKGAAAARNLGFKQCVSPYVLFCDADITMEKTMVEKMLNILQNNPHYSYAYSDFKFGWKKFKLPEFSQQKLKQLPYIHTTSLIKKEHFPGFDESLKRFQDWDLWLTMSEQGHVGIHIPEVLFSVTSGGTMSSWLPSFAYSLSLPGFKKKIEKYKMAEKIIIEKHNLNENF